VAISQHVGKISMALIAAGGLVSGLQLARRPKPPDATIMTLKGTLEDQVREFSSLEIMRSVPPKPILDKDGGVTGVELVDQYSLELEQDTHQLEDTVMITLSVSLYDLAVARTPTATAAAAAHVQHGLTAVRLILDSKFGRGQYEYNAADVLSRIRGTLFQIEALPDLKK
jgi:hypothetical protein